MPRTSCFLLLISLLAAISCNTRPPESDKNPPKPNIIYILADDLGYGDIKHLNPGSKIPTPYMDAIAKEGIHFTDAHSNSSVCSPTRYGVLTGRYAFRTRLKKGVLWGYAPSLIEPGRETVATLLKQGGYHTACIGKWHIGLDWAKKDTNKAIPNIQWNKSVPPDFDDNVDYSKPVEGGPLDHGFDHSFILPATLDMNPYCYIRNRTVVEAPTEFTEGSNPKTAGRGVLWRPGKVAPGFDFYQTLPRIVDSACVYIEDYANEDAPFFLYLPLPSPHTPWVPLDQYKGRSNAGTYGDYVSMTDDMIGRVLEAVENQGISENTLIIVTSDNGSDWRPSDITETGHRANYIFKGRKADIYEGGHRIPFIARLPGVIAAGSQSDVLMCTTDLMATLGGLLSFPLPEHAGEDSYDLWPAFTGKEDQLRPRETVIHHSIEGFFSIRKGKWKYTPHLGSGGFTKPDSIIPGEGEAPGTLYDLQKDPGETRNLYKQHPELVKEMDELLKQQIRQGYSRPVVSSSN